MANSQISGKTKASSDLKNRILFLVAALFVFRLGSHIPVPGVDPISLANFFKEASQGILGMFNVFSGGALSRFSIFAIGIIPYISSSIVMQLASEIVPSLKALKKEGEAGRRIITKYTRIGTVLLATAQSFGSAALLYSQPGLVIIPQFEFYVSTVVCLVTGTMFLMWLGEQITERGIGNGISLIICAGIASGIPGGIGKLLELVGNSQINAFTAVLIVLGALLLVYLVVFFESAQRKIPIHYAKRQVGNKMMQGQNTHLPFKLNMAGVIPAIFASSILIFITFVLTGLSKVDFFGGLNNILILFQHGQPLYLLVFAAAIIFFCYFYTALMYSPREIAENLKKSGAFVPGIRPGEQTSKYFERILLRLTFYGAIYITVVCLIPELLIQIINVPIYLGGTSLLILVVVTMDFATQVNSYRMSQQYESLMNKTSVSRRK